jgi:hypothetical protein
MLKKQCKYCEEPIATGKPYCHKCTQPIINNIGKYTMGMTSEEIESYLGRRANTLSTKTLVNKFNKICGVNTMGVHICPKCGEHIALMYRHDVERFADVLFYRKQTYFD